MRNRTGTITLAVAAATAVGVTAWVHQRAVRPAELVLRFHAVVGAEPLVLNEARYANPGGAGRFEVRDFRFFVSNIRLLGPDAQYSEPDSYHLARFDGTDEAFAIVLPAVPRRAYQRIEFGIGVDAAANRSIEPRGDLDPNGRMAWSWDVGYKFVLFEGALVRGEIRQALVYHVGFDENYRPVALALPDGVLDGARAQLDFRVDVLRLFTGAATIDMGALSTVKFDHADAALLARNYAGMITPLSPRNGGLSSLR